MKRGAVVIPLVLMTQQIPRCSKRKPPEDRTFSFFPHLSSVFILFLSQSSHMVDLMIVLGVDEMSFFFFSLFVFVTKKLDKMFT